MKWRPLLIVVAILCATVAGRLVDVRALAGGIKGDEATYVAMALSLAEDGDLRYQPEDLRRFVNLYGEGPSGIFLKPRYVRGWGTKTMVPTDQSLSFAKALAYPLAAAPFAKLGGLGGLVVFNWLLLAGCVWCGVLFCRAASRSRQGGWYGVVFLCASVVPVYAAWLTSEVFNFALIFFAYFFWLYKKVSPADQASWLTRPWTTVAAAALVGVAVFSKATNAALVGPIVIDALLNRRVGQAVLLSITFVLSAAGLFGLNAVITGEANYQGAEDGKSRYSFYGTYPFDEKGGAFVRQGQAMITNDADTGRVLSDQALAQVPVNTWYFLVGRHAGLIPYYLPGVLILAAWFVRSLRAPLWQWTTFLAVAGSVGALVVFFPDSWNGGGGPPGNRYFLSLYPPLLFLVRPGIGLWPGAAALVGGWTFIGAMLLHPYAASATPWLNVERAPLRWLPIELTLVNDLPCRLNPLRCPILFIREPTVQLYYMDGRTYSAEPGADGAWGVWIAGGTGTDIIVKTDRAPARVRLAFSAPIENAVRGTFADRAFATSVPAGGRVAVTLSRPTPFRYHQNSVYVLHLEASNGFVPAEREVGSTDTRNLGVFVQPSFVYDDVLP